MSASGSGDGQPAEKIEDPGEYNQRRRLRAVHDALDRIHVRRRKGRELMLHGQLDKQAYRSGLREAVTSMLLELEPAMRKFDPSDPGQEDAPGYYWTTVPLGEMKIPQTGETYEFRGVQSVLEFDDPLVVEWEEDQDPPLGRSSHPDYGAETKTKTVQLSGKVLMNAERAVRTFMHDVGLDLGFDRTSHDDGDVDDLEALLRARGQEDAATELPEMNDD